MIKAVIFDLDNTLYAYEPCHQAGVAAIYAQVHECVDVALDAFLGCLNRSKNYVKGRNNGTAASHNRFLYCQNVCESLNLNVIEVTPILYETYWNAFVEKMQLYDGAMELLTYLRERDVKIGICSDLTAHIQFRKLRHLGLSNVVNAIVTSEECGREKPSEDMFKLVLDKLHVRPCDSIMIGDSLEKDVLGAKKAGMKAVLYGCHDNSEVYALNFNELKEKLDAILE